MSGPRTKRQFAGAASDPSQRQITSFFAKASSTTTCADGAPTSARHTSLNAPHLPPQVQTDLLTVGMRVRKAIPEGYKTGSTYSAFSLWAETNNSANNSRPTPASTTPAYSSTMRELEPFCGINKVGGLAFQPAYSTPGGEDAMPGLTSSQDTVASDASNSSSFTIPSVSITTATASTRKRSFTAEEDEIACNPLQHSGPFRLRSDSDDTWLDEEISPRSLTPPAELWQNARLLAVPKRPRQGRKIATAADEAGVGQENIMVDVQGVVDGDDFEEASFLDYGLSGDGNMEIE
ncbi:ribonucleotide reductase inhibitor-domain-containing protein [Achaetomium macrosporum]|uniref:Ribonucleotide reductase inhibitor-domain-containing protein n=1 Tax=Achaetomium macrosporum TaxID=79813 RepID=A0AAN7HD39_9PEZI|nr:ribonucleotide reductase inhibitor-domain-containing protein [Achaetomium macrosporum]